MNTLVQAISDNDDRLFDPEWADESEWKYPKKPLMDDDRTVLVATLLDAGAHPNVHGPNETPPLVDAVLGRQVAILEHLLQQGADPAIECFSDSSLTE